MNIKDLKKKSELLAEVERMDAEIVELEKIINRVMEEGIEGELQVEFSLPKKSGETKEDPGVMDESPFRFQLYTPTFLSQTPTPEMESLKVKFYESERLNIVCSIHHLLKNRRENLIKKLEL